MQLDLKTRPLSRFLSRHFVFEETDAQDKGYVKGLYLGLSVEGSGTFGAVDAPSGFIRLTPVCGEDADISVTADEGSVKVAAGTGCMEIALYDEKLLLISGKGIGLVMNVRLNMGESVLETERGYEVIMGTERYVIQTRKGKPNLKVEWLLSSLKSSDPVITIEPEDGGFELVMMDTDTNYNVPEAPENAAAAACTSREAFSGFRKKLVNPEAEEEAYDLWIGFQYRKGSVLVDTDRENAYQANALEQTFAALAFKDVNDRLCLLNNLFCQMTPAGMVPSYVKLRSVLAEAAPPVYGIAFSDEDFGKADQNRLAQFYDYLAKAVNWWYENRYTADGFFYAYPYECGWPKKPALPLGRPCISPDLQAYLLTDCMVLEKAAETLGKAEDAACWKKRSEELSGFVKKLFGCGRFECMDAITKECVSAPKQIANAAVILSDNGVCTFLEGIKDILPAGSPAKSAVLSVLKERS